MGERFGNAEGKVVVERLIGMIHENRGYLSEIDGAIGDGDHGINMDKGFTLVEKAIAGQEMGMSEALLVLGSTLVEEIGGSMGPLYGMSFRRMARASRGAEEIDSGVLEAMLAGAYEGIGSLGDAKVGDKTLVDTLEPAVGAVREARRAGVGFHGTIDAMIGAAESGWKSTEDMVARVGRASRLGERSRGTVDAGATSCYLILKTLGETMKELAG